MKRVKVMEVIYKWADDFCYSVENISFGKCEQWLVIDFNAITLIYGDIIELINDLDDVYKHIELYSIDTTPDKEHGLSIWFSIQ